MAPETVPERVRELAEHHDMDEPLVIQRGVKTMYRDLIVSRYLAGEITREEAIEHLGVEVVDEIESARDAVEEDVKWGSRSEYARCVDWSLPILGRCYILPRRKSCRYSN